MTPLISTVGSSSLTSRKGLYSELAIDDLEENCTSSLGLQNDGNVRDCNSYVDESIIYSSKACITTTSLNLREITPFESNCSCEKTPPTYIASGKVIKR